MTDHASKLYGESDAAETAQPSHESPEKTLADRLYGTDVEPVQLEVPENVRDLRKQGNPLYPGGEAFSHLDFSFLLPEGIPEAELQAQSSEMAQVIADTGFGGNDGEAFVNLLRANLKNPPDDKTVEDWAAESQKRLKEMDVSDYDLEGARKLAARDPVLHSMLHKTKLGSHPQVVMKLVSLARSERLKGRL